MAIYHFSIKVFSRGKGASAVAKAAYRAAECIQSEYDGQTHDYTKKRGVVHKEIILPGHAPQEYSDRAILWNAVEKTEKPKNAQLAREIELALPVELSAGQNLFLVREFVKNTFVKEGMCADLCVHDKGDGNPHAHIMLTMRPLNQDGTWGNKCHKVNGKKICTVDWNEQTKAEEWRKGWADILNAALQQNGVSGVDHRSYQRQGIDKVPTVHMGVAASQMEQRGIRTELGDKNRAAMVTNKQLSQLRARIQKCKNWLFSQPLEDAPTMRELMKGISGGQNLKSNWKRISDLKSAAKVLIFLQQNGISDMEQLSEKVTKIHQERYDLASKIKAAERRIATLEKHISNVETCKTAPQNSDEYRAAQAYLSGVLNGRTAIPETEWRAERDRLLSERYAHAEAYYRLREDVRNVEVLRRSAEGMMSGITPEQGAEKERGTTLM